MANRGGRTTICRAIVAGMILGALQTGRPAAASESSAGQGGNPSPEISAQAFAQRTADFVRDFLAAEFPAQERVGLVGTEACIEVHFTAEGSFEAASVTAPTDHRLAVALHRKLSWRRLPGAAGSGLPQGAKLTVGIDLAGEVEIDAQPI